MKKLMRSVMRGGNKTEVGRGRSVALGQRWRVTRVGSKVNYSVCRVKCSGGE